MDEHVDKTAVNLTIKELETHKNNGDNVTSRLGLLEYNKAIANS